MRPGFGQTGVGTIVEVQVRDNNVDQALRALKKKMQREGIFREMKLRGHYEKPSERRRRDARRYGEVIGAPVRSSTLPAKAASVSASSSSG